MECEDSIYYKKAMEEEMKSQHKNNTWNLVKRPHDHKVAKCKWVYKMKATTKDV